MASSEPVHAFLEFLPVLRTIFFSNHWLLSHITIVETTDSGERGTNHVAITFINPVKEYWPSQDRTSDLMFSSPQRYRLSYGAPYYIVGGENASKQNYFFYSYFVYFFRDRFHLFRYILFL